MSTITEQRDTSGYALDTAWHAERERLDSLTALYDPVTLELCDRLGVADGWRCLDVGAGTGTLGQKLVERVAPSGSVLAVDVNTRFLEPLASDHLRVSQADITVEAPTGEFDLVHARLLLEHLPARDQVLASLVRATRRGGWLLIEDFDWATALVVDPPSAVHDKIARAVMSLFTSHGYDATYGRTLPRRLAAAGLLEVGTRAQSVQVRADRVRGVPQWDLLVDQLAPGLLASGLVEGHELQAFHELWHDGDTVCFAPLMVSCWGRRPMG